MSEDHAITLKECKNPLTNKPQSYIEHVRHLQIEGKDTVCNATTQLECPYIKRGQSLVLSNDVRSYFGACADMSMCKKGDFE